MSHRSKNYKDVRYDAVSNIIFHKSSKPEFFALVSFKRDISKSKCVISL